MTSNRPYLIRAIYQWIVDNGLTPHLLVSAEYPGTIVPEQFIEDSRIVLNIHPDAVRDLELGDEYIMFSGRFGGAPMHIEVPMNASMALYARENGQGMVFEDSLPEHPPEDELKKAPPASRERPKTGRPNLTVVK